MFIAVDKNKKRIYATELTSKNEHYFCPVCNTEVKLRIGTVNAPHFAHVTLGECLDDFTNDMSEWHRNWQLLFPEANREVVIQHEGNSHRADVLCYGTVIEFQHSPISESEFWRRNEFYTNAGYKVVWIFDLIELYSGYETSERLSCVGEWTTTWGNGGKYRWKHPWRFLADFMPQHEKNITIFFQIIPLGDNPKRDDADCCIEKVTWVNPDFQTIWGYFHTSYDIVNYSELINWLEKRRR